MSRTRYHFLRIEEDRTVKYVVTLPGQTLGRLAVIPGILVKDVRGRALHDDTRKEVRLLRRRGYPPAG